MKAIKSIYLALILVLAVTIISCDSGDDPKPEKTSNPTTGGDGMGGGDTSGGDTGGGTTATAAPDFSLQNLSGETVSLSALKGKVVVLFFFGNSCPACKASAPSVQSKLANAYSSNDKVVVLGLDQWDGTKSAVQGFKNSTGVDFDLLLNASSAASSFSTTYDRLVVVDKEGFIRFKGSRAASSDANDAKDTVETYLNN